MPIIQWVDDLQRPIAQYRPHKYPEHLINSESELKEGKLVQVSWQGKYYPAVIVSLSERFSVTDLVYEVSEVVGHGTLGQWAEKGSQLPSATLASLKLKTKRKHDKNEMLFRVRWSGYSSKEDTLEPVDNLSDVNAFLAYLKKHPSLKQLLKESSDEESDGDTARAVDEPDDERDADSVASLALEPVPSTSSKQKDKHNKNKLKTKKKEPKSNKKEKKRDVSPTTVAKNQELVLARMRNALKRSPDDSGEGEGSEAVQSKKQDTKAGAVQEEDKQRETGGSGSVEPPIMDGEADGVPDLSMFEALDDDEEDDAPEENL